MDKSFYWMTEHFQNLAEQKKKICGYRCEMCGHSIANGAILNVHHKITSLHDYDDLYFNETLDDLIVLCDNCHKKQHADFLNIIPEGNYNFEVTDFVFCPTDKYPDRVSILLKVHNQFTKKENLREYFHSDLLWKVEHFYKSIGMDNRGLDYIENTIGKTGRCSITIREQSGKAYNNVKKWYLHPSFEKNLKMQLSNKKSSGFIDCRYKED